MLKRLSETDYKKLTFADYEIICLNLNINWGVKNGKRKTYKIFKRKL
jgi:hypothetical protein